MTAMGRGAATSRTKSQLPFSATPSISCPTTRRIKGSWSLTRRGVKPRFTRLRRRLWSGSSRLIIDGIQVPSSGRELLPEQKTRGFFEQCMMSS